MRIEEPVSISLSNVEAVMMNEAALHDKPGFDYSTLLLPAIGLVALSGIIWAAWHYWRRRQKLMSTNDPSNLFNELCNAHSLSWSERRALLKLAELRKISNPCLVILDAGLWPDDHDSLVGQRFNNKLCQIRRTLFAPAQ